MKRRTAEPRAAEPSKSGRQGSHSAVPCATFRSPLDRTPRGRPAGGFTLIELLVVAAILGVVLAAIAACLAGGIRAWDQAQTAGRLEADAGWALRLFEKDLMNAFRFDAVPFRGASREVSFPGLIREEDAAGAPALPAEGEAGDSAPGQIGRLTYGFSAADRALVRKQAVYAVEGLLEQRPERILAGVEDVVLDYGAEKGDGGGGAGAWQSEWTSPSNLPACVRIRLRFADADRPAEISRTVVLPLDAAGGR